MNWTRKACRSISRYGILSLVLIVLSCQPPTRKVSDLPALPYYTEASFTPYWIDPADTAVDTIHQIPPFQLVNQEGDTISEATFTGKIYVADFFFTTCPGICPKMTKQMKRLQSAFDQEGDVLLLSHSVTPEQDSVPVLKAYAEARGIEAHKWHLATGDRALIYSLGRTAYFVEEDLGLQKGADEFLHTENFLLIDQNRHIRGIYNGLNTTSVDQLIADIHTLLESS